MRWSPLARKECRAVATSKGVWLLAVLLVGWGYRPSYVGWDALGANMTVGYVQTAATALLPLGVLLLSYQAVVGERSSNSLRFVLSLPLTRTDVLVGKVVGRTAGLAGPLCVAFAALGVIGLLDHGVFDPLLFVGVVAVTLVYVCALVSVAVAISALADRTVTAAGAVFGGVFLPFVLFWTPLVTGVFTRVTGVPVDAFNPPASGPLFVLLRLSPGGAYHVVTNWLLGVGNAAELYSQVLTQLRPNVSTNAFVVEATFPSGAVPWYLHESLGLVVLLAWLVVPLAVARSRFVRGDVV
ncbi:ABC transporter permease [Salinigranum halophilum]|uniref:ABC transporter permease n=1 Tax=Salinigranum halophilum TaxID=2565931 RepID=UPI0010A878ED|nr:ABC transporter permease subunit [Salinigranum halophilum]